MKACASRTGAVRDDAGGPQQAGRLRILVMEREATRLGIRMALAGEITVCGEADDLRTAIRIAKREQPDVCLVGAARSSDALAAVRGICRAAPGTAVVVLGDETDSELLLDAIRAGAVGYLPRAVEAAQLRRVLYAIAAKEAVVPRSMVLDLVLELQGAGAGSETLTGREGQVLGMLRRGRSTSEIAQRLQIAPVTVRRHISELVHKLGVADRTALTASPTFAGMVDREPPAGWPRSIDHAVADREDRGLHPPAEVQLGEDVGYMVLGGPRADGQLRGDLGVLHPLGEEAEDLELAS